MKVEVQSSLFREIILSLFDHGFSDNNNSLTVYDIPQELNIGGNCFYNRESVEKKLPSSDGKEQLNNSFGNMFMKLKTVTHGTTLLPILSSNFNFGCSIPEIALRVGLFLKHTDDEVKAIGYRLESPHGIDKSGCGIHHYYHVQMIKGIGNLNFPPQQFSDWVPDGEPTFPLDAEDSVELLLCLVLGLYGREQLSEFINIIGNPKLRNQIVNIMFELKMGKLYKKELIWYWKATSENKDYFVYYETTCKKEDFLNYAKPRHQNHTFIEVTPDEWEEKAKGDKKLSYKP